MTKCNNLVFSISGKLQIKVFLQPKSKVLSDFFNLFIKKFLEKVDHNAWVY